MRRLPLLALLIAILAGPLSAREWYRPAHAGKAYVNCDLTPERVLKHPRPAWNGQLVLWEGTLSQVKRLGRATRVVLNTAAGAIAVTFPQPALTLQQDRSGFQVGVKGELHIADGKFTGLVGRSAILLGPPKPWPAPKSEPLYSFLYWWTQFHNPRYDSTRLGEIAHGILDESLKNGIDPLLLAALVQVESAFQVDAVSRSGAVGLGQLMPFVASGMGLDPYDVRQNLAGSARMLANLLKTWETSDNPRALALASYNAGPNLVARLGTVPRVAQTTNYVYFIGLVYERMKTVATAQGIQLTSR